jgi:hypothetical protein
MIGVNVMGNEVDKTPDNGDLVWGLEGISQRQRAIDFVMKFENRLCIYSSTVEKLYTNYSLYFPPGENHSMVVIPNQYAYHDTFNNLNEESVLDTNFDIIPGQMIGKTGLYLRIPFKEGNVLTTRPIPFRFAVERMILNSSGQNPFIPVLVKGNLREFELENPYLHLHRIDLSKITKLSEFEIKDIQRVIWGKFKELAAEH